MTRSVPYNRQTLDNPNPFARFAHRARYGRSLDLVAQTAREGATLLDFGAGTAELLQRIKTRRPDLMLLGYEPYKRIDDPSLVLVSSMQEIADGSVDVVCAFEVLEHLDHADLDRFVAQALRVGRSGGTVIISVPIVEGLVLPMKIASHAALFRNTSGYTARDVVAGVFGWPVARTEDLFWSHRGFSHRHLMRRLAASFALARTIRSPFPTLPWWLNSQLFSVWRLPHP